MNATEKISMLLRPLTLAMFLIGLEALFLFSCQKEESVKQGITPSGRQVEIRFTVQLLKSPDIYTQATAVDANTSPDLIKAFEGRGRGSHFYESGLPGIDKKQQGFARLPMPVKPEKGCSRIPVIQNANSGNGHPINRVTIVIFAQCKYNSPVQTLTFRNVGP
jgi:hypothetical protein